MSTSPSNFHQWISRRFDHYVGIPAEQLAASFNADAGGKVVNAALSGVSG